MVTIQALGEEFICSRLKDAVNFLNKTWKGKRTRVSVQFLTEINKSNILNLIERTTHCINSKSKSPLKIGLRYSLTEAVNYCTLLTFWG